MRRPFGFLYRERTRGGTSGDECCLCGLPTKPPQAFAGVTDGGVRFAEGDEDPDMGYFPIGPKCARRMLASHPGIDIHLPERTPAVEEHTR